MTVLISVATEISRNLNIDENIIDWMQASVANTNANDAFTNEPKHEMIGQKPQAGSR